MITIITVTYNDALGLPATMRSVAQQLEAPFQYIVQDGGSSDETPSVVAGFRNVVDKYTSEKDTGIYDAMNKAVDKADGEFTLFMNSGDVFVTPKTVAQIAKNLTNSDDIVFGLAKALETGKVHEYRQANQFWGGMTFDHQATVVRTSILRELRFDDSLRVAGDLDFFSRCRVAGHNFRMLPFTIATKPFAVGASSDWFDRFPERYSVLMRHFHPKFPVQRLLWREAIRYIETQMSTDADHLAGHYPDVEFLIDWIASKRGVV